MDNDKENNFRGEKINVSYFIFFFFILLFLNLPVAFSIGLSSMVALCFYGDLPLSAIVTRMYSGVDSFTLLAIPFFIAAGEIMNESGITDKIVSFSKALVGHIKGGLLMFRLYQVCFSRVFLVQLLQTHPPLDLC